MHLFTAGPVSCRPEILEAMGQQMFSHRSVEYKKLHRETVDWLAKFLETESEVFLFTNSGSGVMEASIRNCVERKVLCCVNGSFGKRYAKVAEANGREVETINSELGHPIDADALDEKLSNSPDVEAVSITYNETSVGLINPLEKLAKVVKKHDKLLLVDAVSAMGGVELKVDKWGIDVCFASSQKCFGIPPGLAVASVSKEALEKSENMRNKGWYFDFKTYEEFQKKDSTHVTPPIPQIAALRKRLELIDEEGGKKNYLKRRLDRSKHMAKGLDKLGLTLFPQECCRSPTISCVNAPEGMNGLDIYEKMREKGFELAKGYGSLKEKTFRIGCMGHIPMDVVDSMLSELGEVVK